MATRKYDPFGYADDTAEAQRVMLVDGSGVAIDPATGSDAHTVTRTRLTAGADRTIPAGLSSYSITVISAASSASPTIGGVAVPAGHSESVSAVGSRTLPSCAVVTVAGDDVYIVEVS